MDNDLNRIWNTSCKNERKLLFYIQMKTSQIFIAEGVIVCHCYRKKLIR